MLYKMHVCLLLCHCTCRNVYHDDRCWFQDSDNNSRRGESEAADMGHSWPGTLQDNHINVSTDVDQILPLLQSTGSCQCVVDLPSL